jgi:hypothetical protein
MHFKYQQWDERFARGKQKSPFDTLWELFQELLTIASGDVSQALRWLTELDNDYGITDQFDEYGMGDFVDELKERGYIEQDNEQNMLIITRKTERSLRQRSLEEIFRNLDKGAAGGHQTNYTGRGLERQPETRQWQSPTASVPGLAHGPRPSLRSSRCSATCSSWGPSGATCRSIHRFRRRPLICSGT